MMVVFRNYGNITEHVVYVIHNSLSFLQPVIYEIPHVLDDRPNTSINGSLWSLQYEFIFYIVAFVVAFASPRRALILILISCAILTVALHLDLAIIRVLTFSLVPKYMYYFGLHFLSGMAVYLFYPTLNQNTSRTIMILAFCLIITKIGFGTESLPFIFTTSALVILICETRTLFFWNRLGDSSYGVYLYAFPVQQLCLLYIPGFWNSMIVSILVTVSLGFASWHLLEKRALQAKIHLVEAASKYRPLSPTRKS